MKKLWTIVIMLAIVLAAGVSGAAGSEMAQGLSQDASDYNVSIDRDTGGNPLVSLRGVIGGIDVNDMIPYEKPVKCFMYIFIFSGSQTSSYAPPLPSLCGMISGTDDEFACIVYANSVLQMTKEEIKAMDDAALSEALSEFEFRLSISAENENIEDRQSPRVSLSLLQDDPVPQDDDPEDDKAPSDAPPAPVADEGGCNMLPGATAHPFIAILLAAAVGLAICRRRGGTG